MDVYIAKRKQSKKTPNCCCSERDEDVASSLSLPATNKA
jgi:hypothetical protein